MTTEEYMDKRQAMLRKISQLEAELASIKDEYIKSSPYSEFKEGEKVQIYRPERTQKLLDGSYGCPEETRIAYIKGFDIDFQNKVKLRLYKAKKNGDRSKIEDTFSPHWGEIIRKFNYSK